MRAVHGLIESNGIGLRNYKVSLYASLRCKGGETSQFRFSTATRSSEEQDQSCNSGGGWQCLAHTTTDAMGHFSMAYSVPQMHPEQPQPPLFVEAVSGPVMLASAIGNVGSVPQNVVINELTTVATGNAFAQFISNWSIQGNPYGMSNAVPMAANLADPQSGDVGVVLASSPNATETSTLATFNSLSNAVASCVAVAKNCKKLFKAATPPGGSPPTNLLQAVANIVKNPSYLKPNGTPAPNDPLFDLSEQREIYSPYLTQRPTNWLLFLRV